jgi:hypothetical protein
MITSFKKHALQNLHMVFLGKRKGLTMETQSFPLAQKADTKELSWSTVS